MRSKVYLVGAGPGDPGLITVKGKQLLEECDVLVYDYLASEELFQWVRQDCQKVCVGKRSGFHSRSQEEICEILESLAKENKMVVRLKGGDPFVFGRGGEEAAHLKKAGIAYEVVPAVTAALASAAYAGIPLTHRDHSSALVFLSGHESPEKKEDRIDWRTYAKLDATLCLYMSMGRLPWITRELIVGGRDPQTPVAVVQWATTSKQRICTSVLNDVAMKAHEEGITSPAIVIIGAVAEYANSLAWFEI